MGSTTNHYAALSQAEFDTLLAWLAPGRDEAGERYEATRRMLTRYFDKRRCLPADECVDETFDRVARRLATGEHVRCADPAAYFRGVARNVCLEWYKHATRDARILSLTVSESSPPSPLPACLEHCLDTLTHEGRELLEAYYLTPREELAARLEITPNAVRVRVFKEKQKLRNCMVRCLSHRK